MSEVLPILSSNFELNMSSTQSYLIILLRELGSSSDLTRCVKSMGPQNLDDGHFALGSLGQHCRFGKIYSIMPSFAKDGEQEVMTPRRPH